METAGYRLTASEEYYRTQWLTTVCSFLKLLERKLTIFKFQDAFELAAKTRMSFTRSHPKLLEK